MSLLQAKFQPWKRVYVFAPPPRPRPMLDIIPSIEAGSRGHKDDTVAEVARAKISGILGSAKRRLIIDVAIPTVCTGTCDIAPLSQLRRNKENVVTAADTGNVTVVMDAADYNKTAGEIIRNYSFKATANDPTRKFESCINKCVREFFLHGKMKKPTYDWL